MVAKGDQIWLGLSIMTKGNQIWLRLSIVIKGNQIWHGLALGPLCLCGSTIRPTLSSFYVFSSMMCEDSICFEQLVPYTSKN
jgi:hypothetical protein